MKRKFWIPIAAVLSGMVLVSCIKKNDVVQCTPNPLEVDRMAIDSFISAEDIHYLSYDPDLYAYWGVSDAGEGPVPSGNDIVAFKMTVSFFNGSKMVSLPTDSIYQRSQGVYIRFSDFQTDSDFHKFLSNSHLGGSFRMIFPSSWNRIFQVQGCQQQSLTTGEIIPAYSQVLIDYTLTGVKIEP